MSRVRRPGPALVAALRFSALAVVTVLLAISTPAPSSAATGDGRASFPAPDALGDGDSGRGLAFDGVYLYWTAHDGLVPQTIDTNIYKVTPAGTLAQTIPTSPATELISLAWDGQDLWATDTSSASAKQFYTVDRQTGSLTPRFSVNLTGGAAACQSGEQLDGLTYDFSTGTLWVSAGASRTVFNITTQGTVIRSFDPSASECITGLSTNGESLGIPARHDR